MCVCVCVYVCVSMYKYGKTRYSEDELIKIELFATV